MFRASVFSDRPPGIAKGEVEIYVVRQEINEHGRDSRRSEKFSVKPHVDMRSIFYHSLFVIFGMWVGLSITALKCLQWSSIVDSDSNRNLNVFVRDIGPGRPALGQRTAPALFLQTSVLDQTTKTAGKDTSAPRREGRSIKSTVLERRKPIYVGVMSATKFVPTRLMACHKTWGGELFNYDLGDVQYLVGLPNDAKPGEADRLRREYSHRLNKVNSVVVLADTNDNEYPPQRKAFLTLKHMCTRKDQYVWFMRADDDVFVRVPKLLVWLDKLDPSTPLYIGQFGYGRSAVRDKLGLKESFCMGGPGVIFSHSALELLCPHIDECLADVVSGEEDVEIGRCIYKHLGLRCTTAYEFMSLFYHAYPQEYSGKPHPYMGDLSKDIPARALELSNTFHHVKEPHLMFRMEQFLLKRHMDSVAKSKMELGQRLHLVISHLNNHFHTSVQWQETAHLLRDNSPRVGNSSHQAATSVEKNHLQPSWNDNGSTGKLLELQLVDMDQGTTKTGSSERNTAIIRQGGTTQHLLWQAMQIIRQSGKLPKVLHSLKDQSSVKSAARFLDIKHAKALWFADVSGKNARASWRLRLESSFADPYLRWLWPLSAKHALFVVLPIVPQMQNGLKTFMEQFKKVSVMNSSSAIHLCVVVFTHNVKFLAHDLAACKAKLSTFPRLHFVVSNDRYSPTKALVQCGNSLKKETKNISSLQSAHFFLTSVDTQVSPVFLDRCRSHVATGREVFFPIVAAKRNGRHSSQTWVVSSYAHLCMHVNSMPVVKRWALQANTMQTFLDSLRGSRDFEILRAFEPGLQVVDNPTLCRLIAGVMDQNALASC